MEGENNAFALPPPFEHWINIIKSFQKHYRRSKGAGMAKMLRKLKIPLEGRHHSGIDDCKNIARIVMKMQADGWEPSSLHMNVG